MVEKELLEDIVDQSKPYKRPGILLIKFYFLCEKLTVDFFNIQCILIYPDAPSLSQKFFKSIFLTRTT